MTNKNLTEIVMVIDRSGSMSSMKDTAIREFNSFLREQKSVEGEANLTLVLFNRGYDLLHLARPVRRIPELSASTYIPDGTTALLDAVGRTIDEVGRRLANTPEEHRPGLVIFVILTDGRENSSLTYTYDDIRQKIKHQEDKYGWKFLYLAVGPEAFEESDYIGTRHVATAYAADDKGVAQAYSYTSRVATDLRQKTGDDDERE